ncbi:MAG TPA: efflux RND transporter periplasmic adaptor subunit [Gammaproteobacteria bacterium]|nr:efflux RND transporter periplasmic adaptor subunit [Gammaproteobacteria bacterium]
MDIPRPELKRKKRMRQAGFAAVGVLVIGVATLGVMRLEPAAPSVARGSVWVDSVRQGEMLREVRGPGTLVPRTIRWIGAQTDGRVERVVVRPGATVAADDVLVEMSNPELVQETEEARYAVVQAKAELAELKLTLENKQLDQKAALASARAEYEGQRLQAEAEKQLGNIVPQIQYQRSELLAGQLMVKRDVEQERLDQFAASMQAQLAVRQARVEQARNAYERKRVRFESLMVHAGIAGVVQEVLVEEGQLVMIGANIARVAPPNDLRAELRVPETQARDVLPDQLVHVDTRNGIVDGRVTRIDPAVQSGTVQVDVDFTGPLPRGARPDLSVDGTIEIERLPNVIYTGRPAYGQPNTTISLFKLVDGGSYAIRVPVEIGHTSVNAVEILRGLGVGDQVILSDTSAWGDHERIRLN